MYTYNLKNIQNILDNTQFWINRYMLRKYCLVDLLFLEIFYNKQLPDIIYNVDELGF